MYKFKSLVDTNFERGLKMKTICIKTNNSIILEYLLNELRLSMFSICVLQSKNSNITKFNNTLFRIYVDSFYSFVSDILSYFGY